MARDNIIKEFTSLKGIGKAKAEILYEAGFQSMDKLRNATIEDIIKIKGFNEKFAKDILNQLKKTEKPLKKTPSKDEKPKEKKKIEVPIEKTMKEPTHEIKKVSKEEKIEYTLKWTRL